MARPKKPTALKKLNGSAKHDPQRINKDEPILPVEELKPPKGLTKEASDEWRRIMPILSRRMRVLTVADYGALVAYCTAFGNLVWSEREISKNGRFIPVFMTKKETGEPIYNSEGEMIIADYKLNPALRIQKNAQATMRVFASSFGLSPADRSKVASIMSGNEEEDEMSQLLSGG